MFIDGWGARIDSGMGVTGSWRSLRDVVKSEAECGLVEDCEGGPFRGLCCEITGISSDPEWLDAMECLELVLCIEPGPEIGGTTDCIGV